MSNIFDLFKKIETKTDTAPVTYIVAGLGNIGKQYERTRHNAGFLAIDKIAEDAGVRIDRAKFHATVAEANIGKVTSSVKSNTYISLVNEKGAKIQNPYLSCDTDMVTVNIPVQVKKEITLKCDYNPDEFEGYEVTIKITDPTVMVIGEVLEISRVDEITIFTLRKTHFDFTGVGDNKLDFVRTVEINLPEGFKLDGAESKAVIEATITKIDPPEPETTAPDTDVTTPVTDNDGTPSATPAETGTGA